LRVRIPGASDVSVDRVTLQRVITDPTLDAVIFLSRTGSALRQVSLEPYGIRTPSGAAWSAGENRLYVVDRSLQKLFALSPGADGAFGTADDSSSSLSTAIQGSSAPRGVTLDPVLGRVGWGDEISPRITWVTTAFAYVGMVDLQPAGATLLRGIDHDPTSRDLFATDPFAGILTTTSSGELVLSTPTAPLGIVDPGGSGLSPQEGVLMVVDLSDRSLVPVDLRYFFLPEVTGLALSETGELTWAGRDVFSSYHLFRGALTGLALGSCGGCFWSGPGPPALDGGTPSPGEGWFYLVAGNNPTGVGSLGTRSDGSERPLSGVAPVCP
jgi:hypothetical protein